MWDSYLAHRIGGHTGDGSSVVLERVEALAGLETPRLGCEVGRTCDQDVLVAFPVVDPTSEVSI